jgi:hypothetical protein
MDVCFAELTDMSKAGILCGTLLSEDNVQQTIKINTSYNGGVGTKLATQSRDTSPQHV